MSGSDDESYLRLKAEATEAEARWVEAREAKAREAEAREAEFRIAEAMLAEAMKDYDPDNAAAPLNVAPRIKTRLEVLLHLQTL